MRMYMHVNMHVNMHVYKDMRLYMDMDMGMVGECDSMMISAALLMVRVMLPMLNV